MVRRAQPLCRKGRDGHAPPLTARAAIQECPACAERQLRRQQTVRTVPRRPGSPSPNGGDGGSGWVVYFSSFTPNSSAASARKLRSSSSLGAFFSTHSNARSYHLRASSFLSSFQSVMARKNQSSQTHWSSPPSAMSR